MIISPVGKVFEFSNKIRERLILNQAFFYFVQKIETFFFSLFEILLITKHFIITEKEQF